MALLTQTLCFVLTTRFVLYFSPLPLHSLLTIVLGRSCEEQMEVCPQGRHDSCQWEGLPFRQVHRVRTHLFFVLCASLTYSRAYSEFEW